MQLFKFEHNKELTNNFSLPVFPLRKACKVLGKAQKVNTQNWPLTNLLRLPEGASKETMSIYLFIFCSHLDVLYVIFLYVMYVYSFFRINVIIIITWTMSSRVSSTIIVASAARCWSKVEEVVAKTLSFPPRLPLPVATEGPPPSPLVVCWCGSGVLGVESKPELVAEPVKDLVSSGWSQRESNSSI